MFNEPVKIILRRFRERILESGLLVIAVALGIGAFSSGISLLFNTVESSTRMISAPSYREITVSTRSDADDMLVPVIEKPASDTAVLTSTDLDAADAVPGISHAYVQNWEHLRIITSDFIEQQGQRFQPDGGEGEAPPEGDNRLSIEDLKEAALDEDIVQSELDELWGWEVTPGFFNAWDIDAQAGSLFSESDMNGKDNLIVLGSDLAEFLADGGETSELLGKKLLTASGYQTIIGILDGFSDDYNFKYFAPYKNTSGGFRKMAMNTQLHFIVEDPEELSGTTALLTDWFDSRFGDAQIVVSNSRAETEQLIKRNNGIGLLILFLSAAGFFIALVNVSNILMSRVIRMKKNVGILMALGSSRKGITRLFLTEALLISLIGAVIGALLAFPLSSYMRAAVDITSSSWLYVLAGALISCVLTTVFGIIPSRQFMKIDPAQAMRAA